MAEFPAIPLWTDAYLADTGHLTTLEHGAYLLLMMACWRNGGRLPNDDKKLARFAHLTAGQWARIRSTIIEFFHEEDGWLVQSRLTDELDAVRQRSKKAQNSARARYRKTKKKVPANAAPEQSERNASISIDITPIAPKKNELQESFDRFRQAYPKRLGSNPWEPARQKFEAAVKAGVDAETIITSARRYAAEQRDLKNIGTEFVMQATRWLNQKSWQDYGPPAGVEASAATMTWVGCHEARYGPLAERYERENGRKPAHNDGNGGPGRWWPNEWIAATSTEIKRTEEIAA